MRTDRPAKNKSPEQLEEEKYKAGVNYEVETTPSQRWKKAVEMIVELYNHDPEKNYCDRRIRFYEPGEWG